MLNFEVEWLEAERVATPEQRETWGRLSIDLFGESPIAVWDESSGSVRKSLYLPLYSLAEWFAFNWWRLRFESHSPARGSLADYTFRHSLLAVGDGFLFPSMVFYPEGDFIRISWQPRQVQHAQIRFINNGSAILKRQDFDRGVREFIQVVLDRLEARGIHQSPLHDEWAAISEADNEVRRFCETVARLGVDPYNAPEGMDAVLTEFGKLFSPRLFNELLAASRYADLADAVKFLKSFKSSFHLDLNAIPEFYPEVDNREWAVPWKIGNRLAQRLRELLELDTTPLPSDSALGQAFHQPKGKIAGISDRAVQPVLNAVARFEKKTRLSVAVSSRRGESKRFALCRALFISYIQKSAEEEMILVTSSHTPIQQASRAFAAEFLAPRRAIFELLGDRDSDPEEIDLVSDQFGVSSWVIQHQLENARNFDNGDSIRFH